MLWRFDVMRNNGIDGHVGGQLVLRCVRGEEEHMQRNALLL